MKLLSFTVHLDSFNQKQFTLLKHLAAQDSLWQKTAVSFLTSLLTLTTWFRIIPIRTPSHMFELICSQKAKSQVEFGNLLISDANVCFCFILILIRYFKDSIILTPILYNITHLDQACPAYLFNSKTPFKWVNSLDPISFELCSHALLKTFFIYAKNTLFLYLSINEPSFQGNRLSVFYFFKYLFFN